MELTRTQLRAVCDVLGGVRTVAAEAGVDNGNLSRWLRGKPTLSEQAVAKVYGAIGLPNGVPDMSRVHAWDVSVFDETLREALRAFFPFGGQVMKRRLPEPERFEPRDSEPVITYQRGMLLLRSNKVRLVLRYPGHLTSDPSLLGSRFEWKSGERTNALFEIDTEPTVYYDDAGDMQVAEHTNKVFESGRPTLEAFDTFWHAGGWSPTLKDVGDVLAEEGVSNEEAIALIRAASKKKGPSK